MTLAFLQTMSIWTPRRCFDSYRFFVLHENNIYTLSAEWFSAQGVELVLVITYDLGLLTRERAGQRYS